MGSSNNSSASIDKTGGKDKPRMPSEVKKQMNADDISSRTRDQVDNQQRANEMQLSKATPRAKKVPSALEAALDTEQQSGSEVANDDEDSSPVGDTSPVDQVPVDTTPVEHKKQTVVSERNTTPSPEERASKIKEEDELKWNPRRPDEVPLDEKALLERRKAKKGHRDDSNSD